jgi:hypothetical protein
VTNYLVFNHHSLPFDHRGDAEAAVPDFLKMCIEAQNAGIRIILVDQSIDRSWFRLELAAGYFWKDWHDQHQKGIYLDIIRAFRSIATQTPFFSDDDINSGADLFDVALNDNSNYSAVRAAAWHESSMAGFETRPPWDSSPLQVIVTRLNPETSEIEYSNSEIINFYSYSIFCEHLPQLLEQRNASILSGKEIVNRLVELYPKVVLCGKAAQQLNNWSASSTILTQVKQSLLSLSQFALKWQKGKFTNYNTDALRESGLAFQVSGESETVRTNPTLRREREFWLPCGRKEYFEQHIKMSFGYRLHFYPDNETCEIFVGYIGPHLKLR